MKKFFSILLVFAICISSVSAYALNDSIATFKITAINHYFEPSRHSPLEISVTTPAVTPNGKLLAVFYTDNKITTVHSLDASASVTLPKISFDTMEFPTPDRIQILTWNTTNLKPLANPVDNALTPEVVAAANKNIVSYILDYLLGTGGKKNVVSFMEGQFDDVRHDKVILLLETMAQCAEDAYSKKETQLLTSEYGRRAYYDEINEVLNILKQDTAQMEELKSVYSNLSGMSDSRGKQAYQVINRLLDFLRIDKDELLK